MSLIAEIIHIHSRVSCWRVIMNEFSHAAVGHEIDESVSGDEMEDIVPYERIRAKNIKEKEEMFKHLFPEVEKGDVFKDVSKLLSSSCQRSQCQGSRAYTKEEDACRGWR